MSRAYRVRWSHASTTITADDRCRLELDLLGILPQGEMIDLLRGVLQERGWRPGDGGALETREGEVTVQLVADGSGIELSHGASHTASARATNDAAAREQSIRRAEESRETLETRIHRELVAAEPAVRATLHQALQEVYVRALKEKAASLGQIEGMVENQLPDGEVEIVIKVRA